jgi:AraC-like DNA-binding protein
VKSAHPAVRILSKPYPSRDFEMNIFYETKKEPTSIHFNKPGTYEIGYIFSGKGEYFINNHFYPAHRGVVFLIGDKDIHSLRTKDVRKVHLCFSKRYMEEVSRRLEISCDSIFKPGVGKRRFGIVLDYETLPLVESLVTNIKTEVDGRELGYKKMVMLLLCQLLMTIQRSQDKERREPRRQDRISARAQRSVTTLCTYIEEHLSSELSLDELERVSCLSRYYLCRVFHRMTGITLRRYTVLKRVEKAKDLLENTDGKIVDIAAEVGYNDLSNFNRSFRAYAGIPPTRYRKTCRQ